MFINFNVSSDFTVGDAIFEKRYSFQAVYKVQVVMRLLIYVSTKSYLKLLLVV